MKKEFIILKKLCAIITTLCFIFTIVCNNLYASINAEPIQAQKQYFSSSDSAALDALFSSKYGKVVSFNNNLSDTVLINVQDLHCDYFVQKNISSLIEDISKKYKIDDVYVEGGIGNIDTSFLANINSEYKQNILDNLLKRGKLTGTEYYSAASGKVNLLKGVEDKEIYLKNIVRLDDIISSKEEISVYLSKINKEIDFLKSKYLKDKNKQFNELLKQSENKTVSQEKFIKELFNYAKKNKISLKNYENLQIYLSLFDYSINNKKVQKELVKLLGDVKQVLSYDEYNELINLTSKLTDIQVLGFFIKDFCKERNINLTETYPNLAKFLALKEKSLECNPIELVKEERKLIDIIRTSLSTNQAELEITYLCDFEQFYENYLSAGLTAAQWEYVKLGLDKFKELYAKYSIENDVSKLERYSQKLNSFYNTNSDRNEIFVKNMNLNKGISNNTDINSNIADILSGAKRIVVLVAGGYHTDGINDILNKKGITNITITPNITNSTQDSRLQYEYLAQQQAMSVRQMIALGLISNATAKEQILTIVSSLLSNQNLDGVNINILVQQLNQIFSQDITVSLLEEGSQLEFSFKDGTKQILDVDKDIANIVEEQNKTSLSSGQLVQVTGDNLKNILGLVSATTFNQGIGVFVPQIYQISKTVCLFMVENKWYLGNGAVWNIVNSDKNGQVLDGIEPIVYEYMPDFMQEGLSSRQDSIDAAKMAKNNISGENKVKNIIKKLASFLLIIAVIFNLTACSFKKEPKEPKVYESPYVMQEVDLSYEQQEFNDGISEILGSEYYVGNGAYRSFLYNHINNKLPMVSANGDDTYALINIENLYDQALIALAYMQIGDFERATEILSAIDAKGTLYLSNLESRQKTGEIVWVGIAVVQYKLLTGDTRFDNLMNEIDSYLNSVHRDGGYYYGEVSNKYVSTEHMFDIIAYFNLKILLYTYENDNTQVEEYKFLLEEAANFIYADLYDPTTNSFVRGLYDNNTALDTFSWGVQVLLSIKAVNPEIYEDSILSDFDIEAILKYAENNFKKEVEYNGKIYHNLYKWSDESDNPVSFEWTMEMAIAYKMAGNIEKAEEIMKDVKDYAVALGFDSYIPYSPVNGIYNYSSYGWKVFAVPAACTDVGQKVQYEYDSFFLPITKIKDQEPYYMDNEDAKRLYFIKQQGSNWRTYGAQDTINLLYATNIEIDLTLLNNDNPEKCCVQLQLLTADPNSRENFEGTAFGLYDKKYYFNSDGNLKINLDMKDFLGTDNYEPPEMNKTNLEYIKLIIISGKTSFGEVINSKSLDIDIKRVEVKYLDGRDEVYTLTGVPGDESSEVPSSILPNTLQKLNNLISNNTFSMIKASNVILNTETVKSLFNPLGFIKAHSQKTGAKILTAVTSIIFLLALSMFLFQPIPLIFSVILSITTALFANIGTHVIIDYRYLKSIGLQEAINLYGKDNVRLTEKGLDVDNADKTIPVYVINDKPKNVKDLNLKPVPIKVKTENGKYVKCWMGNYKGVAVILAEGAEYEDIVNEFGKTRQFESIYESQTSLKANVDVIEIDMVNPSNVLNYSKNGNLVIGANILKTADRIDLEKEISLLKNKKIEAVTINQNIAIYIDDEIDTISTSQDFVNVIDLYIKNKNLGTDVKILFSNKYIDRILELLEQEQGGKELAQQKFVEIIKQLKDDNKEIVVIFDDNSENINLSEYQKYGIFSYIAGNEYVDGITSTKTQAKFVTNLSQISCFDGSLSIIKVSLFRKEIEQSSGIFTFLSSSLNLKEYMKNRSIKFIKQVASNFDYNQIPKINVEVVAKILQSENKFKELRTYLNETDSISIYYLGLSTEDEKAAFIDTILERILVANYLREFDESADFLGLKNKKMETILSAALIAKYNKDGNFAISSQISLNENLTTAQFELEFEKMIFDKVSTGFKEGLSDINDSQSIDDIIKLIPLYAERNTQLRTANVEVMDIQNIKGILSAA